MSSPAEALRSLLWASDALYAAEVDPSGAILDANPALARTSEEDLRGTGLAALLAPGQRPALHAALAAATETRSELTLTFLGPGGEATDDRRVSLIRSADAVLVVAEPASADRAQLVEQVLELNDEILDAQRALRRRQQELERSRAEAQAATDRAARLEAITLSGLSRPDGAVEELLETARSILGSPGARLSLVDEEGGPLRVHATAGAPAHANGAIAHAVLATGRSQVDGTFAGVPLRLDGSVAGVLEVEAGGGGTQVDLRLLEAIGERAALVVGHAQLRERERRISETLQRSLLPQRLPEVAGVAFAAHYRPQVHAVHVGGDFYDATLLPDGRLSLAIGDVAGKGLRAAVLMGQLRSSLRAYALDGRTPGEVLDRLDRLVVEADDFATAMHVVLDLGSGTAQVASAGHPPALLRGRSGGARFVPAPATPALGVDRRGRGEGTFALEPAETLLLYTDGLFERRRTDPDERLEALRVVTGSAPHEPDRLLDHLVAALAGDGFADDVALLAVRRDAP